MDSEQHPATPEGYGVQQANEQEKSQALVEGVDATNPNSSTERSKKAVVVEAPGKVEEPPKWESSSENREENIARARGKMYARQATRTLGSTCSCPTTHEPPPIPSAGDTPDNKAEPPDEEPGSAESSQPESRATSKPDSRLGSKAGSRAGSKAGGHFQVRMDTLLDQIHNLLIQVREEHHRELGARHGKASDAYLPVPPPPLPVSSTPAASSGEGGHHTWRSEDSSRKDCMGVHRHSVEYAGDASPRKDYLAVQRSSIQSAGGGCNMYHGCSLASLDSAQPISQTGSTESARKRSVRKWSRNANGSEFDREKTCFRTSLAVNDGELLTKVPRGSQFEGIENFRRSISGDPTPKLSGGSPAGIENFRRSSVEPAPKLSGDQLPPSKKDLKKIYRSVTDYDDVDAFHHEVQLEVKNAWVETARAPSPRMTKAYMDSATGNVLTRGFTGNMRTHRTLTGSLTGKLPFGYAHSICRRLIGHPSSRFRLIWDVLGMLFLSYDLIMIPLQTFQKYIDNRSTVITTTGYLSTAYWSGDCLGSFFVGYHHAGIVEMHPKKVACHYLKTWFIIDSMLVSVDFLFILMGSMKQAGSVFRSFKTMSRGFRVVRLLRIVKMHSVMSGLMERVRSEYVRTICSIVGLVFFIVILNHFIACGWYGIGFLGAHTDGEKNWHNKFFTDEDHNNFGYRYATSLHWSLTQFTPASMEVVPQNGLERVYSVLVLLFALITFSSFVSSITQAMTHLRKINARRLEQETVLRRYLTQHGISTKLINRVWHYLHQQKVLNYSKVRTKEHDVSMLALLPRSMRVELRFEAYGTELRRHPFFLNYAALDLHAVRQICHCAISAASLLPRQELFSDAKGEIVQMFFVVEGTLEYYLPCACADPDDDDDDEVEEDEDLMLDDEEDADSVGEMEKRSERALKDEDVHAAVQNISKEARAAHTDRIHQYEWACEAALWSQKVELCSPFIAAEKSELLLVNSDGFMETVMRHDLSRKKVARYGEMFAECITQMTDCRWRTVICNDFSTLEDIVHRVFDYKVLKQVRMKQRKTGAENDSSEVSSGVKAWAERMSVKFGKIKEGGNRKSDDIDFANLANANERPARKSEWHTDDDKRKTVVFKTMSQIESSASLKSSESSTPDQARSQAERNSTPSEGVQPILPGANGAAAPRSALKNAHAPAASNDAASAC